MKRKIISVVLALICISVLFVGCGKVVDKNNNVVNGTFSDYIVAEKVGYANTDKFETSNAGIRYESDGKFGVASLNGLYETGTIFEAVRDVNNYFQVWSKAPASPDDISGWNSSKLIDGKGNTIVPEGYAAFRVLNERYIQVATVSARTYSKEKCLVSCSDNYYCSIAYQNSENWSHYTGTWYVYDIVNQKIVSNLSGTDDKTLVTKGRFITYNVDGKYITVDENGETITGVKTVFDDGSYSVESKMGEVYGADGKLLFEYDLAGFVPKAEEYGYYVASKYVGGSSKYAVMDNTGKIISSEFDDFITVYGEIFESGDKIYNLEGKSIIDGTYKSVWPDKVFGQYYMLHNDGYYTLIDKNGAVYFNGPYDDNHTVSDSDFLASEKKDGEYYYYSYRDQDYTIKGYSFAPWIVKTNSSNSLYDLVDTMTGKKLLEGYSDYKSVAKSDSTYYVYAMYNGGADIYLIESSALLEDVTAKKSDLFDELSKAFENEGIKVTVNKETGEIALDSSVLFGGDSAELTSDGKAFLNKFIKAYTTVVGTDRYASFITKTMVEGHTAPVSGSTYASGLKLSEERAANVKNYCLSSQTGVDITIINNKLEAVGYSNSKPVYKNDGSVDMDASRRVSFRFMVNVEE